MAELPASQDVRRPISLKIFGIAIALLVLMIVVTLSSSLNLRRVGQQLSLLSDVYIEIDQLMGDVRAQGLREVIQIERVLHRRPKLAVTEGDEQAMARLKEAGGCDPEQLRPVTRKIREAYPDRGAQQLVVYRLTRLCTNGMLERAAKVTEQALLLPQVRNEPEQVARFATIKTELANIAPARNRLHASFEKYLGQVGAGDEKGMVAAQERIDDHRQEVNRRIRAVTRELHSGTRESAELTERLERRTQWLSWSVTLAACTLGLLLAWLITRSLVRPVRELLLLTRSIRTGNLDVSIRIKTGDEIGQLADSFNHMVGELKQKEAIKKLFGMYVDPRVVQGLMQGQKQFAEGGAREMMSVFFSDLDGFTSVCEGLTPTGAVRLLNQYFGLMAEPIRARQGIIDKYIGDAVMAFWGPPFTDPSQHALLACQAALAQQARVPQVQALLPEVFGMRRNLPTIRVRMGIATGDVTVGSIGSDEARSFTVIGDTVNLASRLEGANKLYGTRILISDDTRRQAGEAIEVREIDAMRVVGKSEPVRVYELLALKGDITPRMAELRSRYEHGLALYRARNWDAAADAFRECLKLEPDDGPAALFLERVGTLRQEALAESWDGVWTLTEK